MADSDQDGSGKSGPGDASPNPSRRSFLQVVAGGGVAGVGLAGVGWSLSHNASRAQPSETAEDRPAPPSTIQLAINGKKVALSVPDQRTLLLALREDLGLTGTKKGCNVGQCGACTVLLDGEPVYSCFVLAKDAVGHEVTTIEGLEKNGVLHPVQQAFIAKMGSQCGMCTNGMIMSGVGLLAQNPNPGFDDVKFALSGVLCRCGNYPHEVAAVLAAASAKPPTQTDPALLLPKEAGLLPPFPGTPPSPPAAVAPTEPGAAHQFLDAERPALDGYVKATGRARYAGDLGFHPDDSFHTPLFAKVVRSPFVHAQVARIDDSEARKLPGYRGMITWADVPQVKSDRHFLNQHARYCGDAVAAVAADDQYTAQAALDLLRIDWTELPPYPNAEENLRTNNKAIHAGGPVAGFGGPQTADKPTITYKKGNVDQGFKEADHVVEGVYLTGPQCHVPIEPHCCTAVWNGDELTLWDTQQSPFMARETLGEALHVPKEKVRVVSEYVGGGFGSKCTDTLGKTLYQAIAATLARKLGKPVRYEYTLEELVFAEDTRNPFAFHIKTGVKKDGTITAMQVRMVQATGGYASSGPAVVGVAAEGLIGAYEMPNYDVVGYSVYTNSPVGGEMRGFGGPQATFAHEMHIDKLAEAVGMNPLDFRKKNVKRRGETVTNSVTKGSPLSNMAPEACLDLGAKAAGWEKWTPPSKKSGRTRRGLGMATGPEHSGRNASDGLIWIDSQGTVRVPIGTGNLGTASHTGIGLIVAQTLGLPLDEIEVTWGDTDSVAWTYVTDASRSTHCDGKAVYNAAQDLVNQLKKLGAQQLSAAEGDVQVQGGKVTAKSGQSVDFRTLAKAAAPRSDFTPYYDPKTDVNPILDEASGKVIQKPPMTLDESTEKLARYLLGKGGIVGLGHYTWNPTVQSWGATFAEVEVDMETGQVEVLHLVAVHDVGTVLYRTGAEAQIHGGVMMGLGFGMREMLESDPNSFIPLQPNYLGLGAPTVLDYPEITPILVEAPVAAGPYGAKGLGENPLFGPPPAIGNAIYNATGVRIDHIPYDWHTVYDALKGASRLSA